MPSLIYIADNPQPFRVKESYDEIKAKLYPDKEFGVDILEQADYIELTFERELPGGVTADERLAFSSSAIILFGDYNPPTPTASSTVQPAEALRAVALGDLEDN